MNVQHTPIDGVVVIEPRTFHDDRGFLLETWSLDRYREAGLPAAFAQDNLSRSRRGVLRGMHFQANNPQGKLVSAPLGEVFDVAVDLREGSATFGQWWGCMLTQDNHRQLWIPPGCAHGFLVISEAAVVTYKCTAYYDPASERTLLWNDPDVGIEWPMEPTIISAKDRAGQRLRDLAATPIAR
jgi:dTDP-4-dehydrorhamnose 3,5-epimerase